MAKRIIIGAAVISLIIAALLLPACKSQDVKEVVIYTSVDQVFSEPVFKDFESKTGIHVLPVYDVEAAKTTGLVNRLIAEKDRPQADVFWSGEFVQTILLKEKGILTPYRSPNAADIPPQYVDPEGYWTGFAARARTLLVNTSLIQIPDYPASYNDLVTTGIAAAQTGMAYPLFGTTATEAAFLYACWGPEPARSYYQSMYDRGIRVVDGNSVVRDLVAGGQLTMGLTDTDDAISAIDNGAPVKMVFLGQSGIGTVVIPNSVGLVAKGPNLAEGKQFIDYLLSSDTAKALVNAGWSHIPLRPNDPKSDRIDIDVRRMDISLLEVYNQFAMINKDLAEIFIR